MFGIPPWMVLGGGARGGGVRSRWGVGLNLLLGSEMPTTNTSESRSLAHQHVSLRLVFVV